MEIRFFGEHGFYRLFISIKVYWIAAAFHGVCFALMGQLNLEHMKVKVFSQNEPYHQETDNDAQEALCP